MRHKKDESPQLCLGPEPFHLPGSLPRVYGFLSDVQQLGHCAQGTLTCPILTPRPRVGPSLPCQAPAACAQGGLELSGPGARTP